MDEQANCKEETTPTTHGDEVEQANKQSTKYVPPHPRKAMDKSKVRKGDQLVEEKEEKNWEYKQLPPPPFPNRLKNYEMEKQFGKFLNVFKQLHINIPFLDALESMPNYMKFLRETVKNKKKLESLEMVALNEECSAILQHKLPPKLMDQGSFTISCVIGNVKFSNILCDLGASINLMPYSLFRKLGIGEVKPTTISLQMADRTVKKPKGILEDVIVKIDKFLFPMDFVVLDMDDNTDEVPLIFGRPFLATSRAKIDVQEGKLTLRVGKEKVTFNIYKPTPYPKDDWCFKLEVMDPKLVDKGKKEGKQNGSSFLKSCFGGGSNHQIDPG